MVIPEQHCIHTVLLGLCSVNNSNINSLQKRKEKKQQTQDIFKKSISSNVAVMGDWASVLLLPSLMAHVLRSLLTAWIRCPNRKLIDGNESVPHSSAVIHSATHNLSHTLVPRVLARWSWPGMLGIWCKVAAQKSTVPHFTNKYVREIQQRRQKRFKDFAFIVVYIGHLSQ